jgi:myo-inositol 2-dehydrogenase / D-chiro-inositol 1-dehydrogenase
MTRIGFVGAGGIAQQHLGNLRQIEGAQVVAVCDVDAGRASQVAGEWGAHAYGDYRMMLAQADLEALYICVPPFAHEGQELLAIERGIPFLVEKPIDVGTVYAERVARAVAERGVLTAVGYHWRYFDSVARAREVMGERPIGLVLGYWMDALPPVPWWRQRHLSGGQFVEQTTHVVDLARYLVGEVTEVYAQMATRALGYIEQFTVPDVGTVTLRFASGAIGTISNTCIGAPGPIALHCYLEGQTVEIGGHLKIVSRDSTEEYRSSSNAYLKEDEAFLHAVRSGDASGIRSPYADALRTQRVCVAASTSAEQGQPIRLEAAG